MRKLKRKSFNEFNDEVCRLLTLSPDFRRLAGIVQSLQVLDKRQFTEVTAHLVVSGYVGGYNEERVIEAIVSGLDDALKIYCLVMGNDTVH
jgi:hypothetical protein